jgi:hypothetical protein
MVIGMDNKPSNAAPVASKFGDALRMHGMHGVISDFTFGRLEPKA